MADEERQEEAEGQEPAEEKPKKKGPTEEDISRLHSTYQKREAAISKELQEARQQAESMEDRVAQLEEELRIARDYGDDDDRAKAQRELAQQKRELAKQQRAIQNERQELQKSYRQATVDYLAKQYGVPKEHLEDYNDPQAMENAALKWVLENKSSGKSAKGQPEDEEPEEETPRRRGGYESGEGHRPRKSVMNMDSKEFEAYLQDQKRQAARR